MITVALIAAICANVSVFLQEPGEIFSWFPRAVRRITKNQAIAKVLNQCPKCQSFWWAFVIGLDWFDIPSNVINSAISGYTPGYLYDNREVLFSYLFSCILAMLLAKMIDLTIQKLSK